MYRKNLSNIKTSRLYCTISSSFIGILVIIVCLLLFSYLMTKVDIPDGFVTAMSVVALCTGSFVGAYIGARKKRQNGMITGIITGVTIYIAVIILGVIITKTSAGAGFFTKLIIALVCGAIGGVVGVNSRQKRY